MILDCVVGSTRETLCNFRPAIAKLRVGKDELSIFLRTPFLALDIGIEVIVPALSTLLPDASRKLLGDFRPTFRSEVSNEFDDLSILLRGPWTFDKFRIQNFLPAVQALHIRASVAKEDSCLRDKTKRRQRRAESKTRERARERRVDDVGGIVVYDTEDNRYMLLNPHQRASVTSPSSCEGRVRVVNAARESLFKFKRKTASSTHQFSSNSSRYKMQPPVEGAHPARTIAVNHHHSSLTARGDRIVRRATTFEHRPRG